MQYPALSNEEIQHQKEALRSDITLGIEQLENGDYTEYNDFSLPNLLETIKIRGKQ